MSPRFLDVCRPVQRGQAFLRGGPIVPRRTLALVLLAALAAMFGSAPLPAQSFNVRITKLNDVAFGSIANLETDAVNTQSICVFAHTATNGYQITASGSGAGSSFAMTSGASSLSYDVLWNQSPGQTSGVQLTPNVTLTGQTSSAMQQTCNTGPAATASLVLVLRAAALSSARAGSYSGTLTLVVGPE
jgi:hypothetical protein